MMSEMSPTQIVFSIALTPVQELRVKGSYLHHKEITAAQGVKIAAPGLENAVAGTQLLVVGKDDDVSLLKEEVMQDMESIFDSVDRSGTVFAHACAGYLCIDTGLSYRHRHSCSSAVHVRRDWRACTMLNMWPPW